MTTGRPLRDTYWVVPGFLLAGRYAGAFDDDLSRERLGALIDAGIRLIIDLTEEGELPGYQLLLRDEAASRGVHVEHLRAPIRDLGVPTEEDLAEVLQRIDRTLQQKHGVYVHCWGGIGRTGTVIGCWLAENGHAGDDALGKLRELRSGCADADRRSPETDTQCDLVRRWRPPV